MLKKRAHVTSKGRITLPFEVRRKIGVRSAPTHRNHLNHLVESLGSPDGLRAVSQLAINTAIASAILFFLLSNHPSGETFFRVAAALALAQALFRGQDRGQN